MTNPKQESPLGSIQLMLGDCLEMMKLVPDGTVDMVLCDLPYGTTSCKWDVLIPFEPLWKQYNRICKGAVVLTAAQPFTSFLLLSNLKKFKQHLIWAKGKGSNPLLANKRIMQAHEDILVFGGSIYNPQMTEGTPYKPPRTGGNRTNRIIDSQGDKAGFIQATKDTSKRFPLSVLNYSIHCGSKLHPTQKPVGLMEYLIKTYTHPGMTVLDNCMGSGTTGVSAVNNGRNFIGIEKDPNYFAIAEKRIQAYLSGTLKSE